MSIARFTSFFATAFVAVSLVSPRSVQAATITYIGVDSDQTNFQTGLDYGNAGYWFPNFGANSTQSNKPTNKNEANALPSWAGPMVHMEWWQWWKFSNRTFSQDGPARSKGGPWAGWNDFTLPNGQTGNSGIILDPAANGNTNNTINKITLGSGTPSSFYLRIVVDNTNGKHNSINRIRARGNDNGTDINPNTFPTPGASGFNGTADVYTFRYDGFGPGDFIKLQLNGMSGGTNNGGSGGASFAGLMFDLVPAGGVLVASVPEPSTLGLLALGCLGLVSGSSRRRRSLRQRA